MFSAAASPYDEIITKATDENLASENWGLNLEVCDKVSTDGTNGARNAIAALQKRLAHRNPNVQLYALELANTLAQNCGPPLFGEMASRNWTGALDRLVNDRTTAAPVKKKALGYIKDWAKQFEDTGDRNLGMMGELYDQLRRKGIQVDEPERPPPESPVAARRRQEDEELQRVLELSKQDKGGRQTSGPAVASGGSSNQPYIAPSPQPSTAYTAVSAPPPQPEPDAAPLDLNTATRVRAMYTFSSNEVGELNFERGDIIKVLDRGFKEWWRGACNGKIGIFPTTYVEPLPEPTTQELQYEAQDEARVFASLGLVDQLLQTLKTIDPSRGDRIDSHPEVEEMYQASVALQGQINKLIKKYSDQKAELEHMNANFTRAMRTYEELKNAPAMSMPQPQPQYGYQPPAGPEQANQYGQYPQQPQVQFPQQPQGQYTAQSPDQYSPQNGPDAQWQQTPAGPHQYQSAPPDPAYFQEGEYPQQAQGPNGYPAHPQQQPYANGNAPPNGQPGQPFYNQFSASSSSLNRAPTGAPDLPPNSPRRSKTQTQSGAAGIGAGADSDMEHKAAWDAYYAAQQAQGFGPPPQAPQGMPPQQGQAYAPPQGYAGSRQSSYGAVPGGQPGAPGGGLDRVTSGMNRMSVHGQ